MELIYKIDSINNHIRLQFSYRMGSVALVAVTVTACKALSTSGLFVVLIPSNESRMSPGNTSIFPMRSPVMTANPTHPSRNQSILFYCYKKSISLFFFINKTCGKTLSNTHRQRWQRYRGWNRICIHFLTPLPSILLEAYRAFWTQTRLGLNVRWSF